MTRILLALLAVLIPTAGIAQSTSPPSGAWPQRPIRLVVPFPAGSSTDVVARIIEARLSPRLGQPLVIDNRSGASGSIGVDAVAKAEPDGYTIGLITTTTHTVAPNLGKKLPYDVIRDFAPIGMIGDSPYVLVVYPGLPVHSPTDLIAHARANPGALTYGSAGPASVAHLAAALFAAEAGLDIVHLPYRSTAHSVSDIMTGRIQMQFASIAPTKPMIETGQLRALATSAAKRSVALPALPTVAEAGLPGFEASLWMALAAPARTPPEIVERINRELNAVLVLPEVKDALLPQGLEPETETPAELAQRITRDLEKWKTLIAKAKIRAE